MKTIISTSLALTLLHSIVNYGATTKTHRAASSYVQTGVPMTVRIALGFRTVKSPFQGVEREREQGRTGQPDYLVRPTRKQIDVTQIVVGNLVRDHKSHQLESSG